MSVRSPTPVKDTRPDHGADTPLWLVLRIQLEYYALPSAVVREIIRWHALTPIPGAPTVLPGIISQRGRVVPVTVPHVLLGLEPSATDRKTRYVFIQHEEVELAFLVDEVLDLVAIAPSDYEALPGSLSAQRSRLLRALTQVEARLVGLIEPEAFVAVLRE